MEHDTESEVRDGKSYFCSENCHKRGRKSLGHAEFIRAVIFLFGFEEKMNERLF